MSADRFFTDFDRFTGMIAEGVPFSYGRYADGEVALMQGRPIGPETQAGSVDRWTAPDKLTLAGIHLRWSFNPLRYESSYYAISAPSDSISDYEYLYSMAKNKGNITFANLWINANYGRMVDFYRNFNRGAYVICNERANPEKFPFAVKGMLPQSDDIVNVYENMYPHILKSIELFCKKLKGETVFIACGPLSAVYAICMFSHNPENQYIDVGSSLDEYIHGRKTRPYMDPQSGYANMVSHF